MPPPWLQNLGDAIAGVDPDQAYMEGEIQRSEIDERQARTDAAMQLAKTRQQEAMIAERERQYREQVAAMTADQLAGNLGVITAGGMGSDYAGAQLGGNRYQEHELRALMADPATGSPERGAAASALAPGSYITNLGDAVSSEPLVIVQNPDGSSSYMPRSQAGGMAPGARPSAAGAGGTNQQKNAEWLVAEGIPEDLAISWAFNLDRDPRTMHQQIYRDLVRNIMFRPEQAMMMADAYIEKLYGPGALTAADEALSQIGTDVAGGGPLDDDLRALDADRANQGLTGSYASPEEVRDAVAAGEIDEATGMRILVDEFGFGE